MSTIYIYIYIYIYITKLASNEIFSPSNKIHQEVGRAKDLSAPLYIVTSLLLKYLKQCLTEVTSFRLSKLLYSRSILVKYTNRCGSVVPNRLDRRDQIPSHFRCIFSISSWLYYFNFSSTLRTFLLFVTVATLPL